MLGYFDIVACSLLIYGLLFDPTGLQGGSQAKGFLEIFRRGGTGTTASKFDEKGG